MIAESDEERGVRIGREGLVRDLREFVRAGHGLVIGRPGVGKTYSLGILAATLETEGTRYLFIAVDELGSATEEELRVALGYHDGTFDQQLVQLFANADSGVVIFDGFDAARSAEARSRLVGLIRRAMRSAPEGWSVLASVRNYDAAKSPALVELFENDREVAGGQYRVRGLSARHFAVPELSDAEVAEAVAQIDGLEAVLSKGSEALRRLVHVPFNLWLVEEILEKAENDGSLSALESETQLLALYWAKVVSDQTDGDARLLILKGMTSRLVSARRLTIQKSEVYSSDLAESWRALLSGEVLVERGAGAAQTAFSHNLLFDYAVSVLVISERVDELVQFLVEDETRPLFLRPSLVYYFTRLWYDARAVFWEAMFGLSTADSAAVRLVGRLIPPYIVAHEARQPSDLDPLMEKLADDSAEGGRAILRVLQALRVLNSSASGPWLEVARALAEQPTRVFAWELANLLQATLTAQGDGRRLAVLGEAARALFHWAWLNRRERDGAWYDAFAAHQAFPLVLRTFASDVASSSEIVRRVLALLEEPGFSIRYFYSLTSGVDAIAVSSPELAGDVYRAVFGHVETSTEVTSLGGIVLPLTSTRRQDFEMCHYALAKAFPDFLCRSPKHAVVAAFDVANDAALEQHVHAKSEEGGGTEAGVESFMLWGVERRYVADYSYIWRSGSHEQPEKLLDEAIRFLVEKADALDLKDVVRTAAEHSETAGTWAAILEIGAGAPQQYADMLFELSVAKPVQQGLDTVHALGTFVEHAYPLWSQEKRAEFEQVVVGAVAASDEKRDTPDAPDTSRSERLRDRLLACIPPNLAVTGAAQARLRELAASGGMPANEPLVRFSTYSRPYTDEQWLAEQGADLSVTGNAPFRELADRMEEFDAAWTNKSPDELTIAKVLPSLESGLELLCRGERDSEAGATGRGGPDADALVVELAWSKLAAAACAVARARPPKETRAFVVAREILLRASARPLATVNENADAEYSSGFWSPNPRTAAIQGLATLASSSPEARDLAEAFEAFASSAAPQERFLVMHCCAYLARHHSAVFWRILDSRAEAESNIVVATAMLQAVGARGRDDEGHAAATVRRVVSRLRETNGDSTDRHDYRRIVADWLVHLAAARNDSWAWQELSNAVTTLPRSSSLLHEAVFQATNAITLRSVTDPEQAEVVLRCREWLVGVLGTLRDTAAGLVAELERCRPDPVENGQVLAENRELLGRIHRLVDTIVTRIYFSRRRGAEEAPGRDGKILSGTKQLALRVDVERVFDSVVEPILRAVIEFAGTEGAQLLVAGTAHRFMELQNEMLAGDPAAVVEMAASVARVASAGGYQFDSLAVAEVVQLVETVLTDHRECLLDARTLANVIYLLDLFAEAGWPEAFHLVWRLDEAFR